MVNKETLTKVEREYQRIRELYADVDPKRLALAEGPMREMARMRVQLDMQNELAFTSGLVLVDPKNPTRQKELPVSKTITKTRASYIAYVQRLKSIMDVDMEEDEDDLNEYT